MRRAGVQPNTVSYNSLLSVCERCGQPERALEVFGMMEREAGPTIGYTSSSLVTYNTLISACGKAGMYDQVSSAYTVQAGLQLRLGAAIYLAKIVKMILPSMLSRAAAVQPHLHGNCSRHQ